ncbi:MAG: Glutaryl-CoA dehydrogenase [Frankiales bacterium]|jgi:glutaryl-CoA dehydrogenase|nr:Glutaryl-CoA dehydrogenase [Frankiales bacterium]
MTVTDVSVARSTDFLRLASEFGDQERHYLERTRAFVDDEVLPVIGDFWERADFPFELVRRMGELGLVGDGIDYPGVPPMSHASSGLVAMELSRGDGSLATFAGVQAGLTMRSIHTFGSEEHKQRWLGPLARVEVFGAFALTEPDHGSDSLLLETAAVQDGDEYVLNGSKRWIGNGSIADITVVWARGEDGEVGGYLVEKGTPGYEATVITGKGSVRAVWQADIELKDVRVPLANKLPGAKNFKDTGRVLAGTRSQCAFSALGHAVAAYDAALTYAMERKQFGKRLVEFQLVQARLVGMLREVVGMQLYCMRLAQLGERGELDDTIASLAKLNNTSKARQICLDARDMLGGNGILLENHVMRHLADVEAIHTYEGTETIQTLLVGREITGVGAFV